MGKSISPSVLFANKNGMKKKTCLKLFVLFFGCLLFFIQCSTRNDPDAQKERLRLAIVSGNGQQGAGGRVLDDRLVVQVKNLSGNPVSGLNLNFQVVEGGGNIPDASSPLTDANGESTVSWVIGSGYNGIEVKISNDNYKASPVYFWAEGENPGGIHITRTIASFHQVAGVLYEMTFYGDYSRESISVAGTNDRQDEFITAGSPTRGRRGQAAGSPSYHCSLFSVFGLPGQYRLGRSFDNPSGWKCLTLLTRVHPNDGYASIAPMRLRDIGFSPESDFDALTFAAKRTFLDAVRFPPDGVNESGLVMGLANVTAQPYVPDPSKETIHFCLWVRMVLNECRTVDEAVALTMKYNILSSGSTLDVHAMVADASGHSLILEPAEGEMKVIRSQGSFQVMTNSPVYQVPLETQLDQCPRFRFIHETLEAAGGSVDAGGCWDILRQVGNVWTEWSAVYGITARSAALAIDFKFDPLYDFYIFPL
jgi:hypothetical protein